MKADPKTEADVLAAFQQFFDAYAERDLPRVIAVLAPDSDWIFFGTGIDERRVGLREALVQIERNWSQSESLSVEFGWKSVSAFGDVAWIAADGAVHWRARGENGTFPLRMTAVFARREEHWSLVHMHASAPLAGQLAGESFPTSIDVLAEELQREQPDLRERAAPDGTVTLLFTDVENSTSVNERLGDQRWLELLRAHHALVRDGLRTHGGYEVKTAGDGFMIAFSSARRAILCTIDIQRGIDKLNEARES